MSEKKWDHLDGSFMLKVKKVFVHSYLYTFKLNNKQLVLEKKKKILDVRLEFKNSEKKIHKNLQGSLKLGGGSWLKLPPIETQVLIKLVI